MTETTPPATGGTITPDGKASTVPPPAPAPAPPPAPPEISISLDHGTHADGGQARLESYTNALHLALSAAAALAALFCLAGWLVSINKWLVDHFGALIHANGQVVGAAIVIAFVDFYLFVMLVIIVRKATIPHSRWWLEVPDRGFALLILALQLFALVMSFATLHQIARFEGMTSPADAFIDTFVTAVTMNQGQYLPSAHTVRARALIAVEAFSALLFILAYFPLLVSRLAMFSSDAPETSPSQPCMKLASDKNASWTVYDAAGKAEKREGTSIKITLTNKRTIEISPPRKGAQ